MRFQLDLKIFILALIFYLTKQIQMYALIMIFAMFHELGHLFAGILLGMKPEKLQIKPYGFSISFKLNTKDYNKKIGMGNLLVIKKILVAFAGPLTNFFIILITFYLRINVFEEIMIIYINIIVIMFNILPIYPLDGGRILKGILHLSFGGQRASKYINRISFFSLIILTSLASIAILYFKNIAIVVAIFTLWILFLIENKKYKTRQKMYNILQGNYKKEYL